MAEKSATSISPTYHPGSDHTFIDMITRSGRSPHWVRTLEGHVLWVEVSQGRKGVTMSTQLSLPEVRDIVLHHVLELLLA